MGLHAELSSEIDASPAGPRVGAFFDLDRTLVAGFSAVEFVRDDLLRGRMSRAEFLETLWKKYRMVVGSDVGCRVFETINYSHLKMNQRLLEDRLRVFGLVKRLSDDCAFVTNPFWE